MVTLQFIIDLKTKLDGEILKRHPEAKTDFNISEDRVIFYVKRKSADKEAAISYYLSDKHDSDEKITKHFNSRIKNLLISLSDMQDLETSEIIKEIRKNLPEEKNRLFTELLIRTGAINHDKA
jgi:hypothetical protein